MSIKKIIVSFTIITTMIMSIFSIKTYAAAGSFSATANTTTLEVNGTASLTIKATDCAGQFSISSSDASVVSISGTSTFLDSSSDSITLTAKKAGTATITVTATDVTDTSENAVTGSKSVTITVKAKEEPAQQNQNNNNNNQNNNQQQPAQQPTTTDPKFTNTSSTMYTTSDCNLRASWSTSSAATWVKKGTQVTVTGTSTEKVNGYVWYRVDYNGTKYIANFLLTSQKPETEEEAQKKQEEEAKKKAEEEAKKKAEEEANASNKALKSLEVEGYTLEPAFSPENTKYSLKLKDDDDVEELKIKALPSDEKAEVTIEGNKDFGVGNKIVKITVTAQDKTTRLYTISVSKQGEVADVDDLKLAVLKVANATLDPTFDKDIKNYTIEIEDPSTIKQEDIVADPEDDKAKATIAIKDNDDGSKLITILLESTDEKDTRTGVYQINVRKPVVIEEVATKGKVDKKIYIIFGSIIGILLFLIILVIIALKKTADSDDEEDDDDDYDDDDLGTIDNNDPKFDQSLKDAINEANGIYNYNEEVDDDGFGDDDNYTSAPKSQILSKNIPNISMEETQLFDSDKFREVSDDNSKRRGKHF